jgi:hypothetical protein
MRNKNILSAAVLALQSVQLSLNRQQHSLGTRASLQSTRPPHCTPLRRILSVDLQAN